MPIINHQTFNNGRGHTWQEVNDSGHKSFYETNAEGEGLWEVDPATGNRTQIRGTMQYKIKPGQKPH